jgi:hypothetical protein
MEHRPIGSGVTWIFSDQFTSRIMAIKDWIREEKN